jgi:hypothetical protein
MNPEGKTPWPFQPAWTADLGDVWIDGRGLLPASLRELRQKIKRLTVWMGTFQIEIHPSEGCIKLDSQVVVASEAAPLFLKRRMGKAFGTCDRNSGAFQCLWYGAGLRTKEGDVGVKLFEDGRIAVGKL